MSPDTGAPKAGADHDFLFAGVAPAIGAVLLGVVLLAAWRRHRMQPFFLRRREVAPPDFLDGAVIEPKPALAEGE